MQDYIRVDKSPTAGGTQTFTFVARTAREVVSATVYRGTCLFGQIGFAPCLQCIVTFCRGTLRGTMLCWQKRLFQNDG